MKYFGGLLILTAAIVGLFLFSQKEKNIEILNFVTSPLSVLEEPPKPLANPPAIVKAIYLTGWTAGTENRLESLIELIKKTELNAAVIDIKDYSGYVDYDIELFEAEKYGAKEIKIHDINALIRKLHNDGIYAIARIAVFQDPILAKARPDLAIKSKKTGGLWLDNKKLAWIDPASQEAWDYNVAIAKDAASRGFDEINFDYIRFASDGNLEDMVFPIWDGKTPKHEVIKSFFKYLREQLPGIKISADLFGLAAVRQDDMGIGQVIEDAYQYFDYVSPMVYPSHYSSGFLNYTNPAQYPYEVIKYSMEEAIKRLNTYELGMTNKATSTASTTTQAQSSSSIIYHPKLRPWLQDFDLGADYDAAMVRKEIQAVDDAFCSPAATVGRDAQICSSSSVSFGDKFGGWMLWNPSNVYTQEALNNE